MRDKDIGKGPFVAGKGVWRPLVVSSGGLVPVFDSKDKPFCWIALEDCAGRDLAAARARATRIAEALDRDVFGGAEKLKTSDYEERAGVVIGQEFVYPSRRDRR